MRDIHVSSTFDDIPSKNFFASNAGIPRSHTHYSTQYSTIYSSDVIIPAPTSLHINILGSQVRGSCYQFHRFFTFHTQINLRARRESCVTVAQQSTCPSTSLSRLTPLNPLSNSVNNRHTRLSKPNQEPVTNYHTVTRIASNSKHKPP